MARLRSAVAFSESATVPPKWLLDIESIYREPGIESFQRGREILARFPDAERILVPSHWKIPGLFGS